MKYALLSEQIRQAENLAVKQGLSLDELKRRASNAVFSAVKARAKNKSVAVFCGKGNNGADGLLVASLLHNAGINVTAYQVFGGESDEFAFAKNSGVRILNASEYDYKADIVIDGIFGFGLNRDISGFAAELINNLNNQKTALKVAIDLPSGVNPDGDNVFGVAFIADETICFTCYKVGMLLGKNRDYCGKISVVDIGVKVNGYKIYEDRDFLPLKRNKSMHKGDSGRVYVIGGCGTMVGAPILAGFSAHAASLNGAGLVTVCAPESLKVSLASRATLSMMKFVKDDINGFMKFDRCALDEIISKANGIVIGVGMGKTPELKQIIKYICDNFGGTLVIDADGLNALKGDYMFLADAKAKIVITPHILEFERLTGKPATIFNAKEVAKSINGVVVLKSATTIITDGEDVVLNISGTPALAKGGSGDVLSGCIAALGCNLSPFDAAIVACYRNGLGAERAVSSYAELMLTPKDILNFADYSEI